MGRNTISRCGVRMCLSGCGGAFEFELRIDHVNIKPTPDVHFARSHTTSDLPCRMLHHSIAKGDALIANAQHGKMVLYLAIAEAVGLNCFCVHVHQG